MKSRLLALIVTTLLLCANNELYCQYITIDSLFVQAMYQYGLSACISGVQNNQMDTTCKKIKSLHYFDCSNMSIHSIEGIQYFDSLETLLCNGNKLTSLSTLPKALKWLNCNQNQLLNLPVLPDSLEHLECFHSQLSNLPTLPQSITYLDCSYDVLSILPKLPERLDYLNCYNNNLASLPALPPSLHTLNCEANILDSLPALPLRLFHLRCNSNFISRLPQLPDSLHFLECTYNKLNHLPALPNHLISLACELNLLESLPELPDSLVQLWCNNNPHLLCLPKLKPLDILEFDFTGVNCIPNYVSIPHCSLLLNTFPLCTTDSQNNCAVYENIPGIHVINLSLYPNPASNKITITYEWAGLNQMNIISMTVINELGQVVYNQPMTAYSGLCDIDVSQYSRGIYISCVKLGSQVIGLQRFCKE